MWIFGYGSIIWRPDFRFEERRPGYVEGWARRFWQGSEDHRGVPGAPGRVVTLVREPDARVWGMAYRLDRAESERIVAALDVREAGGYEQQWVRVHTRSEAGVEPVDEALVYLATPDNPMWAGPAPIDAIARQVLHSEGPSGHNVEYVLELAEALRAMEADDPHVFALAAAVRRLLEE